MPSLKSRFKVCVFHTDVIDVKSISFINDGEPRSALNLFCGVGVMFTLPRIFLLYLMVQIN